MLLTDILGITLHWYSWKQALVIRKRELFLSNSHLDWLRPEFHRASWNILVLTGLIWNQRFSEFKSLPKPKSTSTPMTAILEADLIWIGFWYQIWLVKNTSLTSKHGGPAGTDTKLILYEFRHKCCKTWSDHPCEWNKTNLSLQYSINTCCTTSTYSFLIN